MWVGMSQSTGNIVMHAHHTMHPYLGKPAKIRENLPLLCIDSTLKKKTFYGINKNTDQFLRSEADKCQMCTTKGTLVLKTDQLQKMNWLCFSDPPTSPQNTWCGLQLCHPISEHVFLSFVLTKKVLFIKRNTSLRTLHVDKIKRQYRQVWLFYSYMHLCHRIKRGFVNSLLFLYWHFLCGQRSSFVQAPGTCTQLCSVMESQACVSWSLETGKEKGDLSEDESVGDREHCVFCGAVLRGRGSRERCLHSIPMAPPSLPKPVSEKGGKRRKKADLLEHDKTVQQENESLGGKYNSCAFMEYKSRRGAVGEITPLLLWKPNPPHHREEMCQSPGQPGCCSHHKPDPPISYLSALS